ncbi:MAG: hypothetical protein PF588_05645 [Candidatus Kapabacteria bacterium]|jgi:adenine-specific DNA-methyltransferase|nr:hypothetical protein [Candidatus Kapabacteria bacterium]
MKTTPLPPLVALNKAFMKVKPLRRDFDKFKSALRDLLANINESESEENNKNNLIDFLKNAFYAGDFSVNTKERTDLVIHAGPKPKDKAAVLVEVKRPVNKAEMISVSNVNAKAMQELVLYYLRDRLQSSILQHQQALYENKDVESRRIRCERNPQNREI